MQLILQFFRESIDFLYQLFLNRHLIVTLSIRDFQKKYIRDAFGFLWAILDPLAFITILYFVFRSRYGATNPEPVPFQIYLITGHIAYDMFSGTMPGITMVIQEHSFLLKKINFRIAILPIVSVISRLFVHSFVLLIGFAILLLNHIYPSVYWLQLLYYIFALSILLISLGWLTSSLYLFFPDISNIVGISTRALFFLTPIFWNINGLPSNEQFLLKFNPLYYIVIGYRDSLTNETWFWDHPLLTIYYWSVCLIFFIIGAIVFKKLRPHFADVASS
jgi:ABC-type polysaccharide/polyol phosphate export permease